MFAVIIPALITGAFAERVKFAPFAIFSLLWAILVYNPICHWIWSGGWMANLAGSGAQLVSQLMGVLVVGIYAFVVSWVLVKILHLTLGMRLSEEHEIQGMDYIEHSETAYN